MLGYVVLFAACAIMYRVAEAEDRSGILWGAITFLLCLVCDLFIPFFGIGIGLVVAFLGMFGLNLIRR